MSQEAPRSQESPGSRESRSTQEPPRRQARQHLRINEDWAATAIGLLLLVLIISGVISKGVLQ